MPRLMPLAADELSPEQAMLLAPVNRGEGVGQIASNLFATLVRHPKLYKRWTVFANHTLFKSELSGRHRELAILRTAWRCQAEYEWGQHVLFARRAGLTDDEIERVKSETQDDAWQRLDAVILRATDELLDLCEISDESWSHLNEELGETQILDLIFTVGNYRLLATFMRSVGIERDYGVPGF